MPAAPILAYENLGVIQGSGWLFRGLDIHIGPRDRLALIGRNGAGKTTLMKLLGAKIDSDEGRRTIVPGTRVILLEQEPAMTDFTTLADYVLSGDDAPARYEAEAIADQLGIDLGREAAKASGGERRRAAIVRAFAQNPDVLLLDEPTNHLDIAAIEWIEEWLGRFRGAFVVISHDRTFLTRLTKQTLWLDRGAVRRAEIGFGGFDAWTEQVYAEEARNAEKLDAKLKLEEHWLLRGVTGRRKRNQGRLTKLHEMRAERAAMVGPQGAANLTIGSDDAKTKLVIDAKHIAKAFGERTIIRDLTLRVTRKDRIGIVGANGAGKSTLLKLLTGELAPDTGQIRFAKDDRGDRHRPAAQQDGPRQDRARSACRRRRLDRGAGHQEAHHRLSEGIPVRTRACRCKDRDAVGGRAFAPAARARICPALEPAGARRADQRPRSRNA